MEPRLSFVDCRGCHAGCLISAGPFHLRNFGGRDFVLTLGAPAGDQDHDCGGQEAEDRQPPDVPDQRKAHDHRKERGNETGRAVARHFDRFIGGFAAARPVRFICQNASMVSTWGSTAKL